METETSDNYGILEILFEMAHICKPSTIPLGQWF